MVANGQIPIEGDPCELAEVTRLLAFVFPNCSNPFENAAQFVRDVHRQWKEAGGKCAGKPRHSERYLEARLKDQNTPIVRLPAKLKGKIRLGARDAAALMKFFLSQWPRRNTIDEGEVEYAVLLHEAERTLIVKVISKRIKATYNCIKKLCTKICDFVKNYHFSVVDFTDQCRVMRN